jgi:hypothetical protein
VWERRYYAVLNAVMRLLLRSPWHGLRSGRVVLLEFRGRRSGRLYRMPVSYWERSSTEIVCLTSTTWSRWWVNLEHAELLVVLRGVERTGRSSLVTDPAVRRSLVAGFLTHNAHDAHHYAVELDGRGEPITAEVEALADSPETKVIAVALD